MRILLTGARGFIGRHCLAELVNRGHEVHAVSRKRQGLPGATEHAVDLLKPGSAAGLISAVEPTVVLHLAWCTTPGEYWSSPDNAAWTQASLELLYSSAIAGCRRFVMAGTSAEYDSTTEPCSESGTPLKPGTLYGTCKNAVYSVLKEFAPSSGMTWCWARIFNVYGPQEDPRRLVPSIIRALVSDQPDSISVINEQRDFLHVADVARALVVLAESGFSGPVNIGSGKAVTIQEIVDQIALVIGKQPPISNTSTAPIKVVQAQTDILNRTIGFKPKYTLNTGLTETTAWWLDQMAAKPQLFRGDNLNLL